MQIIRNCVSFDLFLERRVFRRESSKQIEPCYWAFRNQTTDGILRMWSAQ